MKIDGCYVKFGSLVLLVFVDLVLERVINNVLGFCDLNCLVLGLIIICWLILLDFIVIFWYLCIVVVYLSLRGICVFLYLW